MWRTPLQPHISNNNTETLLLNGPTGTESLNTTYTVPKSARILQHMQTNCNDRRAPDEAINNVYELPITEPTIRYLHGAAGFPTKSTWLKAICKANYQSWPLVNSKNVNTFSQNQKRPKRGTCVENAKANAPPKKKRPPQSQRRHNNQQTRQTPGVLPYKTISMSPLIRKKYFYCSLQTTGHHLHRSNRKFPAHLQPSP